MKILFNDTEPFIVEMETDAAGGYIECGIVRLAFEGRPGPNGIGHYTAAIATCVVSDSRGSRTVCELCVPTDAFVCAFGAALLTLLAGMLELPCWSALGSGLFVLSVVSMLVTCNIGQRRRATIRREMEETD